METCIAFILQSCAELTYNPIIVKRILIGLTSNISSYLAQVDTHYKLIGYLLWIFGFTGSHRFYFGKPISGTIWLCTGGLFLIGWLLDLFLIPSMDREADRRFTSGTANYTVAWVLLTFFGYFGLHRLYLSKPTGLIILIATLLTPLFPPFALVSLVFIIVDFWTLNDQVHEKNTGR